jgi:hypothetical protein
MAQAMPILQADHKVRLTGLWKGPVLPRKLSRNSIKIVPGESIFFDPRLSECPAALAVVLRYAFEWQIWRACNPALGGDDIDMLALRAAAAYYSLVKDQEKEQCKATADPLLQAVARLWEHGLALDGMAGATNVCAALRGGVPGVSKSREIWDELASLAAPVEFLLTSGCDSRSRFDPQTGQIAYRSRPFPANELYCFASSTAATISNRAFAGCERVRQKLIRDAAEKSLALALPAFVERLRNRLVELLGLDRNQIDLIFCPSGTDAELFVLHMARHILGSPVLNILTAADETGRGAALAAQGRHFASESVYRDPLKTGAAISGLADDVDFLPVALRDERGAVRSADAEIDTAIETALRSGRNVLLHVMDSSKCGNRCPDLSLPSRITRKYAGRVQIVVDACQLRVSRTRLKWYLDQNHIVEVTGSKFFGAPPFCGAILFRKELIASSPQLGFPSEFANYSSREDWPPHWQRVRSLLPPGRTNVGLMFRWQAAIEVMSDYFSVPMSVRKVALRKFETEVSRIIEKSGFLELVSLTGGAANVDPAIDCEMSHRSILAFFILHHGRPLSPRECEVVFAALDRDIGSSLPENASRQMRRLAAQRCHIGQPVRAYHGGGTESAVLRISAGASMFAANSVRRKRGVGFDLTPEIRKTAAVVAKIGLILDCLSRGNQTPVSSREGSIKPVP